MGKIHNYISRVKSMSLKRMTTYIDQIYDMYGQNKLKTAADMVYSSFRYGTGYLDYTVFGYAKLKGAARETFVNNEKNRKISAIANDPSFSHFLKNKLEFCEDYRDYIGREFLNLNNSSAEDFAAFIKKYGFAFAKNPVSFGGQGVIKTERAEDYEKLLADGYVLIEEPIKQHKTMQELCPACINSLRVVTLRGSDKKQHFMYALLRMGRGNKPVDNITSGGMYILLDENGKSVSKAFCDKTGEFLEVHPQSGVKLTEFEVPCFAEAVKLCQAAADVHPEIGYVGWDVAITEKGPVLIEGNVLPGYDMSQNIPLSGRDHGLLAEFKAIPGFENI